MLSRVRQFRSSCRCSMNNKALVVRYQGAYYFPILKFYPAIDVRAGRVRRDRTTAQLKRELRAAGQRQLGADAAVSLQPERVAARPAGLAAAPAVAGAHPSAPTTAAATCLARLAYGFNVSLTFALLVIADLPTAFGIVVGAHARLLRREARHPRPAAHRDLVVAAVSLHHHHRQLDRRAGLHARPQCWCCSRRSGC